MQIALLPLGKKIGLVRKGAIAVGPEVVGGATGEVGLRVGEDRRDRADQFGEPGVVGGRQWKLVDEEVDVRLGRRSFVRGNVAHFRENGGVEVRVALPGLEDAKEEIEAVHFGLDHAIVVLLFDRPVAGVDGFEARAKSREPFRFLRHGGGAVIGPAMDHRGMVECAPIGEQGRQLLVGRSGLFGRRCGGCHAGERRK